MHHLLMVSGQRLRVSRRDGDQHHDTCEIHPIPDGSEPFKSPKQKRKSEKSTSFLKCSIIFLATPSFSCFVVENPRVVVDASIIPMKPVSITPNRPNHQSTNYHFGGIRYKWIYLHCAKWLNDSHCWIWSLKHQSLSLMAYYQRLTIKWYPSSMIKPIWWL